MVSVAGILIAPLLLLCVVASGFQGKGGREAPPPAKGGGSGHGGKRTPKPKPQAGLLVNVTPSDSTIILNGEIQRFDNGTLERIGLAPGTYRLIVERDGYEPQSLQLNLDPDTNTPLRVALKLITGILNVEPTVTGCRIDVLNPETNTLIRSYFGKARNQELPPGRYQILVSKEGYKPITREVSVKAGSTTLLEPSIEQLPTAPAPTVANTNEPRFQPDAKPQVHASVIGKFIVVVINGRSGDMSNTVGAIDIKLTSGDDATAYVSGMLTGFPCQVDLIRFENVAEYSFVEPPGVANQWARVVVRLRPKSSNRPVHFAINWKTLGSVRAASTPLYSPVKPPFARPELGERKDVDVPKRSLATYADVGLWLKPSNKEAHYAVPVTPESCSHIFPFHSLTRRRAQQT